MRRLMRGSIDRSALSLAFLLQLQTDTPNCGCCSISLSFNAYSRDDIPLHAATLDKIVPALGYVPGNVSIVCRRCNRLKDQMTLDEARMIVAYIERHVSPFDPVRR